MTSCVGVVAGLSFRCVRHHFLLHGRRSLNPGLVVRCAEPGAFAFAECVRVEGFRCTSQPKDNRSAFDVAKFLSPQASFFFG